jgi:Flp pilus assembly protein TadD
MVAWSAAEFSKRAKISDAVLIATGVSVLAVLGIVTRIQVNYWRNTDTLFEHAAAVTNGNYVANGALGAAYAREGRLDDAVIELKKSLEFNGFNYSAEHILGVVLLRKGQADEAIEHFRKAVAIDTESPEAHNTLGAALLDSGRVEEAVPYFFRVLEIDPNYYLASANLGYAYDRSGRPDDAMAWYQKALGLTQCNSKPYDCAIAAQLNFKIGDLAVRSGQLTEASGHFREALRLRPDYPEAQQSLATTLSRLSR